MAAPANRADCFNTCYNTLRPIGRELLHEFPKCIGVSFVLGTMFSFSIIAGALSAIQAIALTTIDALLKPITKHIIPLDRFWGRYLQLILICLVACILFPVIGLTITESLGFSMGISFCLNELRIRLAGGNSQSVTPYIVF